MSKDSSRIPLYTSDLLQDVSIELGRRLKTLRYRCRSGRLEFGISTTENENGEWECFDAIHWRGSDEYIQVVVCENAVANYMFREPLKNKHDTARYEGYIITVSGWAPNQVADLIFNSLLDENNVRASWRKLDQRKCF